MSGNVYTSLSDTAAPAVDGTELSCKLVDVTKC